MGDMVNLAELLEDPDLYPRNSVDSTHINDLLRALHAGATLPPLVVDRKTKTIIDGFHRSRALRRFLGDDAEVAAEFRDYKNKREMFLDAVVLNSGHGRKLDRHDQVRVLAIAATLRISVKDVSSALNLTPKRASSLKVRHVVRKSTGGIVPNKNGGQWLNECELTDEQIDGGLKPSMTLQAGRLALDLTRLIDHGLVNWSDELIVLRLRTLASRLEEALSEHAA